MSSILPGCLKWKAMGTKSNQECHPFEAWFSCFSYSPEPAAFVVGLLRPTAHTQRYSIGWQTTLQKHKIKWINTGAVDVSLSGCQQCKAAVKTACLGEGRISPAAVVWCRAVLAVSWFLSLSPGSTYVLWFGLSCLVP